MNGQLEKSYLIELYAVQLKAAGVFSATQLVEKGAQIDLTLDDKKIIPEVTQLQIDKDNPDKINVAGQEYDVLYKYDSYNNSHSATISIPMADIFKFTEYPTIPSETPITISLVDNSYERFKGQNLSELQQQVEEYLLERTWQEYSSGHPETKPQELKEFDPLINSIPELPEPIEYGTNPKDGSVITAHAALTYKRPYWNSDTAFSIKYYPNERQAKLAGRVSETRIAQAKIQPDIDNILNRYTDYGLDSNSRYEFSRLISELENSINNSSEDIDSRFNAVQSRLQEIMAMGNEKATLQTEVTKTLEEKFSICPVCGQSLDGGACNMSHSSDKILYQLDEDGDRTIDTELARLTVELSSGSTKEVAVTMIAGDRNRRRPKGEVYVLQGYDLPGDRWDGEVGKLTYVDHHRVLSGDEVEKRKTELKSQPLPEGVFLLGPSLDNPGNDVYAQQDSDGTWNLCGLSADRLNPVYFKGFRSKSTGETLEKLAHAYYNGQPQLSEVLGRLKKDNSKTEEVREDETDFALAFRAAQGKLETKKPVQTETPADDGPMSESKRKRVEKEFEETQKKLAMLKLDLDIQLQQEKKKALNITNGEIDADVSQKGTRVIANFAKEFEPGSYYAEVMDWSTGKVRRLVVDGKQGEQYVEVIEDIPGGDFHSEGLDIDGTSHRVKLVDLTENHPQIQVLEEKITKLSRRLESKTP